MVCGPLERTVQGGLVDPAEPWDSPGPQSRSDEGLAGVATLLTRHLRGAAERRDQGTRRDSYEHDIRPNVLRRVARSPETTANGRGEGKEHRALGVMAQSGDRCRRRGSDSECLRVCGMRSP